MQFFFAKVEKIKVESYTGPVFNLQTDTGEYIANRIVVHNCPHNWSANPDKLAPDECPELWMGQ